MKTRRRKTPETPISATIRTYAAGYAADGQKDFAAGMLQAADLVDKFAADGAPLSAPTAAPPRNGSPAPHAHSLEERVRRIENILFVASETLPKPMPKASALLGGLGPSGAVDEAIAAIAARPRQVVPTAAPKRPEPVRAAAGGKSPARPLGRCECSCLRVLSLRGPLSRTELAIRAGYAVDSGGYAVALANLRARGALSTERGDVCKLTGEGLALAMSTPHEPRAVGNPLEFWCGRVGACASAVLQTLVSAYPETLERSDLADRAGYSAESGGFAVALAKLRRLELVDGLRASGAIMAAISPPSGAPPSHGASS